MVVLPDSFLPTRHVTSDSIAMRCGCTKLRYNWMVTASSFMVGLQELFARDWACSND